MKRNFKQKITKNVYFFIKSINNSTKFTILNVVLLFTFEQKYKINFIFLLRKNILLSKTLFILNILI